MNFYRVVSASSTGYVNEKSIGCNTFSYENQTEYLHFFILPETARHYQELKYKSRGEESFIIKCQIPLTLIKNNFGIGLYGRGSYRIPFPEARLPKSSFKESMVVEKSPEVKEEWCDNQTYQKYIAFSKSHYPIVTPVFEGQNTSFKTRVPIDYLSFFKESDLKEELNKNPNKKS